MTADCIPFLRARIAEDRSKADRALTLVGKSSAAGITLASFGTHGNQPVLTMTPERMIAECDFKEHLVDMYERADALVAALTDDTDMSTVTLIRSAHGTALVAVGYAAAVYNNHPDYQEEWRL